MPKTYGPVENADASPALHPSLDEPPIGSAEFREFATSAVKFAIVAVRAQNVLDAYDALFCNVTTAELAGPIDDEIRWLREAVDALEKSAPNITREK